MPNIYKRKAVSIRENWTGQSLKAAINAVKNDGLSVRAAGLQYIIPRKTLERRIKKNNDKKRPIRSIYFIWREEREEIGCLY